MARRVGKLRTYGYKVRKKPHFYQGDRVRQGSWSKKRWSSAQKSDRKRSGAKYEKWEK